MHGGRDRKDGTDIAGTSIEIRNNTFRPTKMSVVIRGVPHEQCEITRNWFVGHGAIATAVGGISERTRAFDNVFGPSPSAAPSAD